MERRVGRRRRRGAKGEGRAVGGKEREGRGRDGRGEKEDLTCRKFLATPLVNVKPKNSCGKARFPCDSTAFLS